MESDEDLADLEDLLAIIQLKRISRSRRRSKKRRSCWRKEWVAQRELGRGTLGLVHNELATEDPAAFKNFLRMMQPSFNQLLELVDSKIKKQDTNMRDSISSRDRLTVTLRFLATGESYQSLHFSTRIPTCTISLIVPEVCQAIYDVLKEDHLKCPDSEEEWNKIARDFHEIWNYPNCIGAMDGKHINFRAPRCAGSVFYNYKSFHSIVLLALVDANYKFIYIDVGTNGRISDGGVFRECSLAKAINSNTLNIPPPKALPGRVTPVPRVIVADDAFTLSNSLMKPYPNRGLSIEERLHNYRLSRARRVSENAFGILANRFRIFLAPINLSDKKVRLITLTCCALHNFLRTKSMSTYIPHDLIDREENGIIVPGTWREQAILRGLNHQGGNRVPRPPIAIRDEYKDYFSNEGKVPWQDNYIFNT